MEWLIGGIALVLLALGFGPAVRGTAAAFDALENPTRPETAVEHEQNNSDLARLLVLLVGTFGLLFAMQMGG